MMPARQTEHSMETDATVNHQAFQTNRIIDEFSNKVSLLEAVIKFPFHSLKFNFYISFRGRDGYIIFMTGIT
jgi:hypothetical protein